DARRALRFHPDPAVARLRHGDRGKRSRRGRRDLALPGAGARGGSVPDASYRAPYGSNVMERAALRKTGPKILKVLVLAFFTVALAFPFFWMLIATFKQNIDLYTVENNPFLFNLPPTLDHLRFLFTQT